MIVLFSLVVVSSYNTGKHNASRRSILTSRVGFPAHHRSLTTTSTTAQIEFVLFGVVPDFLLSLRIGTEDSLATSPGMTFPFVGIIPAPA